VKSKQKVNIILIFCIKIYLTIDRNSLLGLGHYVKNKALENINNKLVSSPSTIMIQLCALPKGSLQLHAERLLSEPFFSPTRGRMSRSTYEVLVLAYFTFDYWIRMKTRPRSKRRSGRSEHSLKLETWSELR
jgi:hypothetical protein